MDSTPSSPDGPDRPNTAADAGLIAAFDGVRARLAAACTAAGRPADAARLLAVSKTVDATRLRRAFEACGQRAFGENYVQEALGKMDRLADLALEWHFIGPLQSNKTRDVAERFAWVHSVERPKIAERLSAQRPAGMAPLQVCIQVNVSGEASKSGCAPAELPALARAVAQLPNLRLRGLMSLPEPTPDVARQHADHARLRGLLDALRADGLPELDTLSMGMSADMEAALAEGATIVRVGTALFGARVA